MKVKNDSINIDQNSIFFVIPKDKEKANNPLRFKIENIIDFNTCDILLYVVHDKHIARSNTIRHTYMEEYGYKINFDLVLKVPFQRIYKDEYAYASYYPYSMQQANFLYNLGIDTEFLTELYRFTIDEIKQGFAIRKSLKEEFYPFLMEKDKEGYYYFSTSNTDLPEFISLEGINCIKAKDDS